MTAEEELRLWKEANRWRNPQTELPPLGIPIILKWMLPGWNGWNTTVAECHLTCQEADIGVEGEGWYFTGLEEDKYGEDWIYMGDQNEAEWRWIPIPPDPDELPIECPNGESKAVGAIHPDERST